MLGQALTTADGTYQVAFPEGGTELALVLVFDDGGQPWTASTALAVGLRVSPAPFNGILYEVTVAGDSGETEPDWQALADNNGGRHRRSDNHPGGLSAATRKRAGTAVNDGSVSVSYQGGTGTTTDPYIIATEEQMVYFLVNDLRLTKYFALSNNLDMQGHSYTTQQHRHLVVNNRPHDSQAGYAGTYHQQLGLGV